MLLSATAQPAPNPAMQFFAEYGLLIILVLLIGFMFWSSRRRSQRMKAEQAEKAKQLLPGAKVLLQGGFYGTLVEYDADDLSKSALVALAPGVEVEVHSQAILRVVDPTEDAIVEEEYVEADDRADDYVAAADQNLVVGDATRATSTEAASESVNDTDDKPKA